MWFWLVGYFVKKTLWDEQESSARYLEGVNPAASEDAGKPLSPLHQGGSGGKYNPGYALLALQAADVLIVAASTR